MRLEDWDKSYEDFYINPKKEENVLREVVGDDANDEKRKQTLNEAKE